MDRQLLWHWNHQRWQGPDSDGIKCFQRRRRIDVVVEKCAQRVAGTKVKLFCSLILRDMFGGDRQIT